MLLHPPSEALWPEWASVQDGTGGTERSLLTGASTGGISKVIISETDIITTVLPFVNIKLKHRKLVFYNAKLPNFDEMRTQ